MSPVFEWDNRKAKSNFTKHRVQFTEAASVFRDPLARTFPKRHIPEKKLAKSLSGTPPPSTSCWFVSRSRRWTISASSALAARPKQSNAIMKSTSRSRSKTEKENGLRAEYRFDYQKSKPNRFAARIPPGAVAVLLDPDVARVFKSAETVNGVLRAVAAAMPRRGASPTR